jgi:hypothetical protein
MKRSLPAGLVFLLLIILSVPAPANAAVVHFRSDLSQAWNEVFIFFPPEGTGSTATGLLNFDYDTDANLVFNIQLSVQGISLSDLSSDITHRTHIHLPYSGEIMVDIGAMGLMNVTGGFETIGGGSAVISDLFETELLSGLSWINVHTLDRLVGEIAGVVTPVPVPAPAPLLLLVSGLFGLLGFSRSHLRKTGRGIFSNIPDR